MGLWGGDSSSSTTVNQTDPVTSGAGAVSLLGQAANAATNGTAVSHGNIVTGNQGKDNVQGAAGAVTTGKNSKVNMGGYTFDNVKGAITINQSDPALEQQMIQTVTDQAGKTQDALGQYLAQFTTASEASNKAGTDSLNQMLAGIKDLSLNAQTAGASTTDHTVLYLVLGLAAAAVAIFFFWKK